MTGMTKVIIGLTGFLFALPSYALWGKKTSEQYYFDPYHPQLKSFINEMCEESHFNKSTLNYIFKKTQYIPAVLPKIHKPYETKPWDYYRRFFVNEKRIQLGAEYWKTYATSLQSAYEMFGVDPSVIVSIIGIESYYGDQPGKFQEIGALATLAFGYPPRSNYFRKELKEYLILTRDLHLPTLDLKGSYAGALGIPQFMPSSYRHFAVNFEQNEKIDLLQNHHDAIASIANYLHKGGWHAGEPIAVLVKPTRSVTAHWIAQHARSPLTVAQWKEHGFLPQKSVDPNLKATLLALDTTHGAEYWLLFSNFKAILSYNHSDNYAMAVYLLGRSVREVYERNDA